MNYRKDFQKYLDQLSQKKPAPGGGSAGCLMFCLGVSLIEKAARYSWDKEGRWNSGKVIISGREYISKLTSLKEKIFPYIDLDGMIFSEVLKSKGEERLSLLKKSEKLVVDTGKACLTVFSLAKKGESGIKKNIISDFYIGLSCVKTALLGCLFNLEGNIDIFKRKSKYIDIFRKGLKEWQ